MRLDNKKKKLMSCFDLMLDTARQIVEDLGGELYDELERPVDGTVIKSWREKFGRLKGGDFTQQIYSTIYNQNNYDGYQSYFKARC
jgi:hypothetical protein